MKTKKKKNIFADMTFEGWLEFIKNVDIKETKTNADKPQKENKNEQTNEKRETNTNANFLKSNDKVEEFTYLIGNTLNKHTKLSKIDLLLLQKAELELLKVNRERNSYLLVVFDSSKKNKLLQQEFVCVPNGKLEQYKQKISDSGKTILHTIALEKTDSAIKTHIKVEEESKQKKLADEKERAIPLSEYKNIDFVKQLSKEQVNKILQNVFGKDFYVYGQHSNIIDEKTRPSTPTNKKEIWGQFEKGKLIVYAFDPSCYWKVSIVLTDFSISIPSYKNNYVDVQEQNLFKKEMYKIFKEPYKQAYKKHLTKNATALFEDTSSKE